MGTKSYQHDQLEDKELFSQKLLLPTSQRTMLLKFYNISQKYLHNIKAAFEKS